MRIKTFISFVLAAAILGGCGEPKRARVDSAAKCRDLGAHWVARRQARFPDQKMSDVRYAHSSKLNACVCSYSVADVQGRGHGRVLVNTSANKFIAGWGGPKGQEWGTPGAQSEAAFDETAKSLGLIQ